MTSNTRFWPLAMASTAALTALPTRVDLAQLFQVDLIKPARGTVGRRVAADIAGVIETLAGIVPRIVNRGLDAFRRAFRERWEDRVMPLAEVLDPETVEIAIYSSGGMDIMHNDRTVTLGCTVLAKLRAFLGLFAEAA